MSMGMLMGWAFSRVYKRPLTGTTSSPMSHPGGEPPLLYPKGAGGGVIDTCDWSQSAWSPGGF